MRTRDTGNRGKPATPGKPILLLLAFLWITGISTSVIVSDVYASSIQLHDAPTIFAASCSTCHGAKGLGGVTFVKDGVGDNRTAPQIAGKPARYIKSKVRSGSKNGAMPAFGKEEITDAELNALANWLEANSAGVPPPTASGTPIRLDITDADPWFTDHNVDTNSHNSRLVLGAGQYLKVVNTGRTWHTLTNSKKGRDSGFIGYAGNYRETPGDLDQGQTVALAANEATPGIGMARIGYYLATQASGPSDTTSGLAYGCTKYWCKMHPYMAVEVCGNSATPGGLTRASKSSIGSTGLAAGASGSEVWVSVQSQEEANELRTVDVGFYSPNSTGDPIGVGNDMDGVYQAIDATNWTSVSYIANVGNNPHNSWPGKDGAGNDVVLSTNWHDNSVSVMDVATKSLLREKRSGATTAHMMVTPGATEDFYVTHMGGRAIQRLDVDQFELGFDPNISPGQASGKGLISGATGPHGLWFCDPQGADQYILTADTFANGATIYDVTNKTSQSTGSSGSAPLAPSIMSGYLGGCERGFTNNALTTDVSIYDIDISPLNITRLPQTPADVPAPGVDYNAAGNINLKDLTSGGCTPVAVADVFSPAFVCTDPVRWASLPIQTPVSPAGSRHPRYMVTANKASFNVSVTELSPVTGLPTALYTFPAGLGAHGVSYGEKAVCTTPGIGPCYYAFVTNTFEGGRNGGTDAGYISVYDLEKIATAGAPGSAFGITATHFDPDLVALNGDDSFVPAFTLGSQTVTVEGAAAGIVICDLLGTGLCTAVGLSAFDILAPANSPSLDIGTVLHVGPNGSCELTQVGGPDGMPDIAQLADCLGLIDAPVITYATDPDTNATMDLDGDGVYPDLIAPITALCPDCRSGVHAGDVALQNTPGLISDSTEYTYYQADVYVDNANSLVATISASPSGLTGATVGFGGQINMLVPKVDLDLQINSGAQGIVGYPAATPWP